MCCVELRKQPACNAGLGGLSRFRQARDVAAIGRKAAMGGSRDAALREAIAADMQKRESHEQTID
jgi:hypothetical protein